MQNADYIIIGSGSVEMLLPFFSFPTLPFENGDAADSKGNRAKGQIDTKHLMHNNCAEQARRNGKVAHPTDVHPVAWRTHRAAIQVDIVDASAVLRSRSLSRQPLAFERGQFSQQFVLEAFLGHSMRTTFDTTVLKRSHRHFEISTDTRHPALKISTMPNRA